MTEHDKRQDGRLPVLWTGTLTTEDEKSFPCQVRDISHAGTLVSCDAELPLGANLLLEIEELGEFAAQVKWQGSEQLGLMILAGPDLVLKKFAETSGADLSEHPSASSDDPLAAD
jgi:hypothetical protein